VRLADTLDPNQIRTAPFERDEPAKEWRNALREARLPSSVLDFYDITKYLSASRLAGFDTASKRAVTVYMTRVFGSLKECLEEAFEMVGEHKTQLGRAYNPLRVQRNEAEEQTAGRLARRAFRLFVIDIFGAFDSLTELVGLLLPGEIKDLRLGTGMFTKQIYNWATRSLPDPGSVLSPALPFVERLHTYVRHEVVEDAIGASWFDLLRLYRNKVTHLGHQTWPEFGIEGRDANVYYFLPRSWPFIAERYFHIGPMDAEATQTLREHLNASLVHIDVIEFVEKTYLRADAFIEGCVRVLYDAYRMLGVRRVDELSAELDKRHVTSFTSFDTD
jgi:hypothetical protein